MSKAATLLTEDLTIKPRKPKVQITNFPDLGVEVRRSDIHGRGVFATKFFGIGWFIGAIEGIVNGMPDVNCPHSIWFEDFRGRYITLEPYAPFKFLNHAKSPNAEMDQFSLYALNNIMPGDEITIYYGDEWEEGHPKTLGPKLTAEYNEETSE